MTGKLSERYFATGDLSTVQKYCGWNRAIHHRLRRLPRPCRRRWKWKRITPIKVDELFIRQPLADHATHNVHETASVAVLVLALVESIRLLIAIPEQMKRLYVNVSPFQASLEQRPEVFQFVRVHVALRVALQMVNDLAVVIFGKIIVG